MYHQVMAGILNHKYLDRKVGNRNVYSAMFPAVYYCATCMMHLGHLPVLPNRTTYDAVIFIS